MDEAAIGLQRQVRIHAWAALLGLGGFAGLDGGHGRRPPSAFFIVKEQTCPGFAKVPLHVVGQHAEEQMGLHAIFQPVMDGADLQIHTLEATKGSFDLGQFLVGADGLFRRE